KEKKEKEGKRKNEAEEKEKKEKKVKEKIEKKPPVNETDVKEFIDRLVFVVEQPGEEELEHEVKELIRKMIRERMEIDDYDKIIEDVENKFKEWVESPNRKYWTQVDVIRVLNDAT